MLTVREAMSVGPMQRARVIGGADGLDNVILSVTVMDTPDMKNWLRGGELLLSNVYVIKDDPASQIRLVQDAAQLGAAALGIKLKRFVESIPGEMVELADRLRFPLLEMPLDCAWVDVMAPLYSEIVNRQLASLQRSQQIHDTFTQAALEGGGLEAIVRNLSLLTGSPTAVADITRRLLAWWPPDAREPLEPAGREEVPPESVVYPVRAGRESYGFLILQSMGQVDMTAVEHAATVAALEMAKLRAVAEVERRFQNDFLWDVLNGNIESPATIASRAGHLGIDFSQPYAVLVVDIDDFERYCMRELGGDEERVRRLREKYVRSVKLAALRQASGSLCMDLSDSVTVLVPVGRQPPPRSHLIRIATAIQGELRESLPGLQVSVGIGRVYEHPLHLAAAYREARQAVRLGRQVRGNGAVTHFDQLGSYRVLLSRGEQGEVEGFYKDMLGPLEDYDRNSHQSLIETLATFFQCGGDPEACARRLYVHPNTVRYRLRKVETLCGVSLANEEDRFNLHLALKLRCLLGKE